MQRIKTAIHLHTNYSFDSNRSPRALLDQASREGVGCVAITDHDAIDGALEARALAGPGVRVIVGEEISTTEGHLIGLFLKRFIEPGMSPEETVAAIREQGGLVFAPHPFATLCDNSLGRAVERLSDRLDAVEVFNAQNVLTWQDRAAARFASAAGLTPYVGIDGHLTGPLAPAYQLLPEFDGPRGFLAALRQAEFVSRRFGPGYFARMGFRHFWDMLMPTRLPGYGTNSDDSRTLAAIKPALER